MNKFGFSMLHQHLYFKSKEFHLICDVRTTWSLWIKITHTSLLWVAVLLTNTSGACHFFMLESSLWVAAWFFLVKTPCRPQSLAVNSLLIRTLWARMFPWIRSLLWRNSCIGKRMGISGNTQPCPNHIIHVINADLSQLCKDVWINLTETAF